MKKVFTLIWPLLLTGIAFSQSLVSVSPATAAKGQTLNVDIVGSGTHFTSASNTVLFFQQASPTGSILVNSVSVQSATKLRANIFVSGSATAGVYSLAVFNMLDNAMMLNNSFTVTGPATPKITQVSPNEGKRSQKLTVDITGSNTHFLSASTTLSVYKQGTSTLDFIATNYVAVYSDTHMEAELDIKSNQPLGEYDVTIFNPQDGFLSLSKGFKVSGPAITNITPNSGVRNQTLALTITGSNVNFQQGTNTVRFFRQGSPTAEITSASPTVISASSLSASATIAPNARYGYYDVEVTNQYAGKMMYPSGFTVINTNNPEIMIVTPASGVRGKQVSLTITGTNTNFTQGSNLIQFFRAGSPTTNIFVIGSSTVVSNQTITANVMISNQADTGNYTISVYNDYDGLVPYVQPFKVLPRVPRLLSVFPSMVKRGATLNVTITGENTSFMSASGTLVSALKPGPIAVPQIQTTGWMAITETQAQCLIQVDTNAPYGPYQVLLVNPVDGVLTLNAGITVIDTTQPPPQPTGLNELVNAGLRVYPNPARNEFHIELTAGNTLSAAEVFDVTGKQLPVQTLRSESGHYTVSIVEGVAARGLYIVKVQTKQGVSFSRIMIE